MTDNEKPLVTFALFAYNQEQFVREAVEGAFAQTYEPLEIILSDDCSTDRTFEIMREMSAAYEGPHKIILNRNDTNYGLTPHVFNVANIASGKLLIAAAADDVSFSNRTRLVVENWLKTHCSASTTDEEHYDVFGTYRGYFKRSMMANSTIMDFASVKKSLGCTWSIDRELLLKYPAPSRDVVNEDVLLGLIAALHNGVSYIPVATVKRTVGVGISSDRNFQSKIEERVAIYTRRIALLKVMVEVVRKSNYENIISSIEEELNSTQLILSYAESGKMFLSTIGFFAIGARKQQIIEILKITLFRIIRA
ncbi:glycosyltransferase [Pseudomonas sp. N040]|uniref:glycosyltransferase n=1 Tax=Pseudomonas sp. N040 TaxID=2785325 RepID=UPI0018A24A05|nr:glycosyltransferase [Pseudomonas sp. N040]MBF7730507.1 glycosyltransferase [Pseudomonas sp. N040]MBW7014151.1 glycosyltransferase [Pseudomonas sp. N040]